VEYSREVRKQLISDCFPFVTDLDAQAHLTYWSNNSSVPQPLLDILPFGQALSLLAFYQYVDFQLPELVERCLATFLFWSLGRTLQFATASTNQITLFYDKTFFWHYFVPVRRQEIIDTFRTGHKIRFLFQFILNQEEIKVDFHKIHLCTGANNTWGIELVYCPSKVYKYRWLSRIWETTITNHEQHLIDPLIHIIPSAEPSPFTYGRECKYQDQLQRILSYPTDLCIDTQYWDTPSDTESSLSSPSSPATEEFITARALDSTIPPLVDCLCKPDICCCEICYPGTPCYV
jgi:hypothetical protein